MQVRERAEAVAVVVIPAAIVVQIVSDYLKAFTQHHKKQIQLKDIYTKLTRITI